jgi:hypothetical protein
MRSITPHPSMTMLTMVLQSQAPSDGTNVSSEANPLAVTVTLQHSSVTRYTSLADKAMVM